jgi:hypothetical protein
MKRFLLFLVLPLGLFGQTQYSASKATSLSGAAEVITIQGNGSSDPAFNRLTKVIALTSFDASCSVACSITLERDGTAATTTTLTPATLNAASPVATALAFSASNVGTGTVLAQYNVAAGGVLFVSLAGKELRTGAQNLTVRTSSITGTVTVNLQWSER